MHKRSSGPPTISSLLIIGLMGFGGYKLYGMLDSKNWPDTTAKVTSIEIVEYRQPRARRGVITSWAVRNVYEYAPVVNYVYLLNHVSYEGSAHLQTFSNRNQAASFAMEKYPKGSHLQVYYNPQHPNMSTLTRSVI